MQSQYTACLCGCGRTFPAFTSNGRPRHFFKGHGNAGRVPAACGTCGKAISVGRWRREKFRAVYCSHACSGIGDRVLAEFACSHCGKTFHLRPSRKQGKRVFCSSACFNRTARPNLKVAVACDGCGASMRVFPSKAKLNRRFYCTVACRARAIMGRNNPAYTCGTGRRRWYGDNWKSQRRACLIRDGGRCQHCGNRPLRERYLHAHHVTPAHTFGGDWLRANDLSNLIALCHTCHKKAEHGKIILQLKLALAA